MAKGVAARRGEEREAPGAGVVQPSLPPLYIGALGGGRRPPRDWISRGAAAKGAACPQAKWGAPTPRVSNPRRKGGPRRAHQPTRSWFPSPLQSHGALRDRWPHPVDTRDPSGGPGTIPVTPKTFPMAETGLLIYNSSPPDHSGTPRDVRDLIRDSEQLSGYCILTSQQP